MKTKAVPLVVLLAAITAVPVVSYGLSGYPNDFMSTYPNSAVKLQSCNLCHTVVPGLNNYGADFAVNRRGSSLDAFRAIQALDSDSDGFNNLEEINAGSMPGDIADTPSSSGFTPAVPGDGTITLNLSAGGNISIPPNSGTGFAITCGGTTSGIPPLTPAPTNNAALCLTCHRDGRSGSTPSGHPDISQLSQILFDASGGGTPSNNSAICAQCHGSGRSGTIPNDHEDLSGNISGGGGDDDDDDD
jgi:hypothetical protein